MKLVRDLGFLFVGAMVLNACGGGGSTSTALVENIMPVASTDNVTLNENQNIVITLNGTDANNDTLTYSTVTDPSHGTYNGTTYIPDANYVGADSFTFIANDGTLDSLPATINISVLSDFDGDNISDDLDPDDDNDGISDEDEDELDTDPKDATSKPLDTDGDGSPDLLDSDDDNDGVSDTDEINAGTDPLDASDMPGVSISGTITYDRVPSNSNGVGLDYNNITQEKVKNAVVELLDASDNVLSSTITDSNGFYQFPGLQESTSVKVRVYAKMQKTGTPSWDVKIVDNTNSDSQYVMEGSLSSSGTSNSSRNLNAPSGWGGSSYTSTRTAAPFAILDDVYYSMQRILSADAQAVFPALQVNWSVNNVPSSTYNYDQGQIGTSHYTNSNLYILGDANTDTDEYDNHIIAHEWGHYYEDKFSRSDSLGGSHGGDDVLDIRVAFGEGWGNAFSAMALDDPIYFDTLGFEQATGFEFNVEHETHTNAGWYSESSVQRILYDLYDGDDDGSDLLSLGFGPIHQVFTGAEKVTPAFTSIFTFITALKSENSADASEIDSIVSSENIATITDIYGIGRTNKASDYPYYSLNVGSSVSVLLSNTDGTYNKLSNRKYVRFTIATAGTYTITVQQTNGTNSDPDFYLFKDTPFANVAFGESATAGLEVKSVSLSAGSYILDIADYNNVSSAQLSVSVN